MNLSTYRKVRLPNFSVRLLRDLLIEADLDWRSAFEAADLDPAVADRPGGTLPARKELAFQLRFVELTRGREDLWLRAGRRYILPAFGAHGWAVATSPTLDAWASVSSDTTVVYALAEYSGIRARSGGLVGIEIRYPDAPAGLIEFSIYRDLVATTRALDWLWGSKFPLSAAEIPLAVVSPLLTDLVPGAVYLGSDSLRLIWDESLSQQPLPFGDPFQHEIWLKKDAEMIRQLGVRDDWPSAVVQAIERAPDLNRGLANVAAALNVSTRTLQRRLDDSGREFSQLRDEALRSISMDLLDNTNVTIGEIARRLGYAEPASFTVAFKRWTGSAPSAFRLCSARRRSLERAVT